MMKIKTASLSSAGAAVLFLFWIIGSSGTVTWAGPGQNPPTALQKCVSDEVGIAFACDPLWKLSRLGKTLKVTISAAPLVEVVILENDQTIHFMSELSADALAGTGRYEKDFHIERIRHCERETVKVNGYLKGRPDVRVSDFYLIDHLQVHSVKFTVDPKEAWGDYQWLIKEVIDSVRFIKHKPGTSFSTEETDETCEDLVSRF